MDRVTSAHDLLEGILLDENKDPTNLHIGLLESITDDFSDDQNIGSGGFADVYKGQLQSGMVAVKKLKDGKVEDIEVHEKKFMQEVDCLLKVKHKNIVRFLGYCFDTQGKVLKHKGKNIMAEERQRFLCFEFLPQGSLDKHISDASHGLEWRTRYHVIKGVCEGLQYLHGKKIVHADLKPGNILLDHNMVPKICDFGLARSFLEEQTSAITQNAFGTPGYMAPESFRGVITFKSDIYSLGVIITEMLTGEKKYDLSIENVHENWTARFKMSHGGTWLEHVRVCAEIGLDCMDLDPHKRPTIGQIIDRLDELEHKYGFIGTDLLVPHVLDVYPLYISFPFKSNKAIKYPVTLTNKTDDLLCVLVAPTSQDACSNPGYPYVWEQPKDIKDDRKSSIFRRLRPHSSETIYMTMRKQGQPPRSAGKGLFDVVIVAMKSEEDLKLLDQHWNNGTWMEDKFDDPLRRAKELGTVVHQTMLRAAVSSYPAIRQEVQYHQFKPFQPGLRRCYIYCLDVHPTETWVLVSYSLGHISIWNYETQEIVTSFKAKYLKEGNNLYFITSVKFIVGEQWFAAGDDNGGVHVYAYTNFGAAKHKVKEFKAQDSDDRLRGVDILDVYPKHTLLLTASSVIPGIKLWDWRKGWTCTRVIDTHDPVSGLKVGPRDASIFASTTGHDNNTVVKVWDIHSPHAIAIVKGQRSPTFYTDSHQDFLATISGRSLSSYNAMICDLQTKKHVHTLYPGRRPLLMICSHPTLPILAGIMTKTWNNVHEVVLWDARTYRVVKTVELMMEGRLCQMVFNGTKDIARNLEKHLKRREALKQATTGLSHRNTLLLSTELISLAIGMLQIAVLSFNCSNTIFGP